MKHLRYLWYVLRHKWFVFIGCMRLGVPLWQAIIHDWTKFQPIEWFAYVERMSAGKNSTWHSVTDTPEYKRAWEHHWQSNPHHWEYWRRSVGRDEVPKLPLGTCVAGIADNGPLLGIITESRIAIGSPPAHHKLDQFHPDGRITSHWFMDFEIHDVLLPMPDRYAREMVADWYGAGMAQGKPNIREWYAANKHRRTLHPATQQQVEELLINFP